MPPVARTELDPKAACRACGRRLPDGKSVCEACGAAHGEASRCPHCDALADVESHPALGFRCLVCGGPRMALDVAGVTPSAPTQALLKAAGHEQTKHVMFSAAGFLLAGMGALALLIATAVVSTAAPGLAATLATYLGAGTPFIAGLLALSRAAAARRLRGQSLRAAQISALCDVQAVTGVLDAERVGQVLRVGPERAELLLAEASVSALLEQAPAPRLRVEALAPAAPATVGARTETATEPSEPPTRTVRGDTET